MKTILITGGYGNLGREVVKLFPNPLYPSHKALDIEDPISVNKWVEENKPDIVIHLAAAVSPPKCEKERDWAWRTNVDGTRNLIEACQKFVPHCYFIYMGTPCEFNGDDDYLKGEYDISFPDNYYGLTKMIGSLIVGESKLKTLIIRGNFVSKKQWPYPKAFIDRISNYLFAHQLAKGIKEVIDTEMDGIVHIVGNKVMSMYDLAKLCPNSEKVEQYTLQEYYRENPNSCKLTKNMVLNNSRWKVYDIGGD